LNRHSEALLEIDKYIDSFKNKPLPGALFPVKNILDNVLNRNSDLDKSIIMKHKQEVEERLAKEPFNPFDDSNSQSERL
jgi:hypothetical protein